MRYKVYVCGDIVEVYGYHVPVKCGVDTKSNHPAILPVWEYEKLGITSKEELAELRKREDNLLRARQNVRRIIWSNQGAYTKFVTLTYAQSEFTIEQVRRNITTFVQSMRRKGYDMKYLYVLEHQTERGIKEGNDGSLHIHMLIFIDKYIPYEDLNKCWKKGSTDIQAIENINNLGAYVCKYITKETFAEFGNHCYERSQNLKKPTVERFYHTNGLSYSDSAIDIDGSDVLKIMNINYQNTMHHDYISSSDGSAQSQIIDYWQGTFADKEFFKREIEGDKLYVLKRKLDDLHIQQND